MRIILEPLAYQYGVDLFFNGATAALLGHAMRRMGAQCLHMHGTAAAGLRRVLSLRMRCRRPRAQLRARLPGLQLHRQHLRHPAHHHW